MNNTKRILVLSVPRLEPHRPPVSAAIVATTCKSCGHDVTLTDLNIEFFNYCKQHNKDYFSFDPVWEQTVLPDAEHNAVIDAFIKYAAQSIAEQDVDIVMVSVFAYTNHYFATHLLEAIAPGRKFRILVGGPGAFANLINDSTTVFVDKMLESNLIDDYISGEAEVALVKYLDGQSYPGVNNRFPEQIVDLDALPNVDYNLVDLSKYDYIEPGVKDVYIEGSRGCIRKCTYCDVAAFWPSYRYHSGQYMAQQIIANYEASGIKRFYFTDSLVNGNLKTFSAMCEVLAGYQYVNEISWSGQFIFRSKKTVGADYFEMIAAAGGDTFYVGVESGSDRVRKAMGKEFTNDDIKYHLDGFMKNGLKTTFLMFPGYVTETLEDHNETIKMFERWQKYVASGTINGLELGFPLMVLNNTPLSRMVDDLHLRFLDSNVVATNSFWVSDLNPDLDFPERVQRQVELYRAAAEYMWPIWRYQSRARRLKQSLLEFYKTKEQSPYKYRQFKINPWRGDFDRQ